MRLIGYSSDDLPDNAMRFGKRIKSKKQRREEIDAGIKKEKIVLVKKPTAKQLKKAVLIPDKNISKCCYCETNLNIKNLTKDHLWPRSKGGNGASWKHENIVPCCYDCNQEKADMTPIDYIKYLYDQAGTIDGMLLARKIVNVQNLCGVEYEKHR